MSQWTSVCTHAHTDYGLASSLKIVEYAVSGKSLRPCVHVAMVTVQSVGTSNVTRLRELARKYPDAVRLKIYNPEKEDEMKEVVEDINAECGESGVNLLYTCPDWCEEDPNSGLIDVSEDILSRTFHHNCVTPTLLSKLFYPALQQASRSNPDQPLNRRRAAIVHLIGEPGSLGDFFEGTNGVMYAYSASLAAMIMSMKTMSYELKKRNDGILVFAVITDSPHLISLAELANGQVTTSAYDVNETRALVSGVVHAAGEDTHGKCLHYRDGRDVSY